MKKLFFACALALASLAPAQSITLSKAVKTSENSDKFLYRINPSAQSAEYLGEVEIQGASKDDPEMFAQIYKKAKVIGANAFSLVGEENIDGTVVAFNPARYRFNLYYATAFPKEDNVAYLFSSSEEPVKLRIDGRKVTLQPKSYLKKVINFGGENYIVAGRLLGSRVNLTAKEGQPVQYFQISSFDIKGDQSGQGGLNIKSGDIIGLERSYAEFLTTIYKEQKY